MFAGHRNQIKRWRLAGLGMNPLGFLPTNLANLEFWVKADKGLFTDAAATIPAVADGDVVGAWEDQSGNGRNATQAVGAKKGELKLLIQNNRPIVRFDGTDDILKTGAFALNQPTHIFLAVINRGLGASDRLFDGNAVNTAGHFRTGGNLGIFAGVTLIGLAVPGVGTAFLSTILFNGVNSSLARNNLAAATGNAGAVNAGGITLGARGDDALWGQIDICEMVVYNEEKTAAETLQIQTYLNSRWTIF